MLRTLNAPEKPIGVLRTPLVLARKRKLIERFIRSKLDPLREEVLADCELPREQGASVLKRLNGVGQVSVRFGGEDAHAARGSARRGVEPESRECFVERHCLLG